MPHRGKKEQGIDRMTLKQRSWAIPVILLAIGMVTAPGRVSLAQDAGSGAAATPDVYSQDDLLGMEKKLKEKTDASGLATQTIKKYSTDYSMLAYRTQSGKAELHEKFADFYVVVAGNATLVSGGKMVNGATTAPGEVRGDSIQNGQESKLKKGDIVHIPANIPHQLVLTKGDTFQYFIVKVQEIP
jgi:mannose-6-phosphate isomerase-like protein (cupin superfamily)